MIQNHYFGWSCDVKANKLEGGPIWLSFLSLQKVYFRVTFGIYLRRKVASQLFLWCILSTHKKILLCSVFFVHLFI